MSSIMSQPPSSNYLPHQYSHQQPFLHQSHSSNIRDTLLYGTESRPPMLLPGTYTDWKQRFLQWLNDRPHADLMLKSIQDGPYEMKFISDTPGIIRLQTKEDLSASDLAQYDADLQVGWFISMGLPNSIYMHFDYDTSAHAMWKHLESLHRAEELHHYRMREILESCLSMKLKKTILPAPPSPAVVHDSFSYSPAAGVFFFHHPNEPEPIFIPQYHRGSLYGHMQSLLQNLVKLGQVSTEKGKGVMASTSECLNTMEDTDDEQEFFEPIMAFMANTEIMANVEAQEYDSTPLFDTEAEVDATLSHMEDEGGNHNVALQSFMANIPSDDEYEDLEPDTADVMLMASMQELHMDDTDPVYDTHATDDSEDPVVKLCKEKCMASFILLHSHLKLLSNKDLAGTRLENGFKRAFPSFFGEDLEIFTHTMFLNMDQLENQLNKEELHENGSMAAFCVLKKQFQQFIRTRLYSDDDSLIASKYFLEYTRLGFQSFKDILLQLMDSIEKLIAERILHEREFNRRVNESKLQTQEGKVNTAKALDAGLVDKESSGTELEQSNDSSRLENDADADYTEIGPSYDSEPNFDKEQMVEEDVIPIYDTEPNFDKELMVEVQSTVVHIMSANDKQQSEQPEFRNEGEVDQNVVQCLDKRFDSEPLLDNRMTETSNQTLESENILLKKTIAQFQKDFSKLEAHCISLELKLQNESLTSGNNGQFLNEQSKRVDTLVKENELLKGQIQAKGFVNAALQNKLRRLTGQSVDTKFAKPSILGKPPIQTIRKPSVVRQPTAFKSERAKSSKSRFASQVVEINHLTKPVTPHSWPKENASVSAIPQHMIIPGSSRISSKTVSKTSIKSKESYDKNDMYKNYDLEKARKKALLQKDGILGSKPRVMPSTISSSKPKPKSTQQTNRNWLASKSSCVNNHDVCASKYLPKGNSRAKAQSCKTNKPVEPKVKIQKPKKWINIGHRFSQPSDAPTFHSTAPKRKTSPRSNLRWVPTGRIFKMIGLRWIPTGKILDICTKTNVKSTETIPEKRKEIIDIVCSGVKKIIDTTTLCF